MKIGTEVIFSVVRRRRNYLRPNFLILLAGLTLCRAGMVDGTVLENQLGRPLARARVVLRPISGSARDPLRVNTDVFGRFVFPRLQEGFYLLSAGKSGYAIVNYGQSHWNAPGKPFFVEADGRVTAELRLPKLGVLTGEVYDENRVGIPNYPVLAYRDGKPLRLKSHTVTDDRGVFRIAGLEPGRYQVRTGPNQLEDGSQLLPTWFGELVEASQPVEARLDEETPEIRITPTAGKLLRLSGKVAWPATTVALYSELGRNGASITGDGSFAFTELPPGKYELIAESDGGRKARAAYQKVYLDRDIEGIVLEPSPAPRLEFNCESEEWNRRAGEDGVSVTFKRTEPPGGMISQQGGCSTRDAILSPGTWEVAVSAPKNVVIESLVDVADESMRGNQFRVMPGEIRHLFLRLSGKSSRISGVVLASGGGPGIGAAVLLYAPDEGLRWRIADRNATHAGGKGEYRLDGLPPGEYRVLATTDYQDPDDVDWSVIEGKTVHLAEGEDLAVNLEL